MKRKTPAAVKRAGARTTVPPAIKRACTQKVLKFKFPGTVGRFAIASRLRNERRQAVPGEPDTQGMAQGKKKRHGWINRPRP